MKIQENSIYKILYSEQDFEIFYYGHIYKDHYFYCFFSNLDKNLIREGHMQLIPNMFEDDILLTDIFCEV